MHNTAAQEILDLHSYLIKTLYQFEKRLLLCEVYKEKIFKIHEGSLCTI